MVSTYRQYLIETLQVLSQEPSSFASKEAKKLGLEYYGFGRYGKKGVVTHITQNGSLTSINKRILNTDKHQKIVNHTKGLASDAELAKLKLNNPEKYKKTASIASEKLKQHQKTKTDKIKVYQQLDKVKGEYQKFFNDYQKSVEKHHDNLKNNYDWRGFTPDEKETLRSFSVAGFGDINTAMNTNSTNVTIQTDDGEKKLKTKDVVKLLDSAMEKTKSPAIFDTFITVGAIKPGKNKVITTNGYKSGSLNPSMVMQSGDTVMQVKINKGDKGIYMDGNYTFTGTPGEREFVFPRDTSFMISDKPKKVLNPETNKLITIYQAEIVPNTKII